MHLEPLACAAMAEITGLRENTRQVRAHRARGPLRHQLGDVVDTWWQRRAGW